MQVSITGAVMKAFITLTLAVCLLAVSFAGHCGLTDRDPGKVWMRANIVLDASGKLTSIEWLGTKPGGELVTAPLENVLRTWEFEPGKINGVPVTTQTGLWLNMRLSKSGKDKFVVHIDDAGTGPISDTLLAPPSFPIKQVYAAASAYMDLVLDIDEAGKVVSVAVSDYAGNTASKPDRKAFEAAAIEVAYTWKYRPEIVGGKPLASKLTIPMAFCIDGWCARHERKLAASGKNIVPVGTSVALDSAVKILTRTDSVEI